MHNQLDILLFGTKYQMPSGITVLQAIEQAGFNVTKHSSCQAGMCGACTVMVRLENTTKFKPMLGCQTMIEQGMAIEYPPKTYDKFKAYDILSVKHCSGALTQMFPEIYACVNCGDCTKGCPQHIDVRQAIDDARFGDLVAIAKNTFSCISCLACQISCPAKIAHTQVFCLARTTVAKSKGQTELMKKQITQAEKDQLDELCSLQMNELKELYALQTKAKG